MKFEFVAVTRRIDAGEYTAEYAGQGFDVRVNLSREEMRAVRASIQAMETPVLSREERAGMTAEALAEHDARWEAEFERRRAEVYAVLAMLWGEEWPAAAVRELQEACQDRDPQFWRWLQVRTYDLVFGYQAGVKKN